MRLTKPMDTIRTSLHHRIVQPDHGGKDPAPALLLLHGRGTSEDDLLGLAPYLDPRFFVIAPRAPFEFSFGGFAWYEIREVGAPVSGEFDESYDRLVTFLGDVKKHYPVDPKRVYVLGFSMGAVMSHALALTLPGEVRGIVAHSGYVPEQTSLTFHWDNLAGTRFFVAHGIHDPVIPVHFGRRAKELLSSAKADLTYKEYPIPHTMSEESLTDFTSWLKQDVS
ncbi:MAG: alpha/beta fold hydrolase [Bacteroidota bacterium]